MTSRLGPRSRTTGVAGAIALLLVLAACSDGDESPASLSSPAPRASKTPTPNTTGPKPSTPSPTGSTSAPAGYSLDDIEPSTRRMGGNLGATGIVRVGHHPDFDRVVWQFTQKGRPSIGVRYVDEPRAEGSGDRIDIRGEAYLQVDVSTMSIPDPDGPRPTDAPDSSLAGTVVADARAIDGAFEGYGQAWIGVRDQRRPFRVMVLRNPTRVVVDVYSG